MAGDLFAATSTGLALAISYNPIAAVFCAPVAAALLGVRRPSHARWVWACSIVGFSWLVGDGLRILGRTRDIYDGLSGMLAGTSPLWAQYAVLAIWALGGLLLGYVLPVWTGVFVGRRVTHGTGWVAAGSIAVGASLALSTILGVLAR